jgi:uncharacterized protein Veg
MSDVREYISNLKGRNVDMEVCRGRKKVTTFSGIIEDIYPSVFTVKLKEPTTVEKISYSYSDVLCGEVRLVVSG